MASRTILTVRTDFCVSAEEVSMRDLDIIESCKSVVIHIEATIVLGANVADVYAS